MSILMKSTIEQGAKAVSKGQFSSVAKKTAQRMNKLAINASKSADSMSYTYSKATPEDFARLTSKNIKDSYKRVTWTNPEDGKVYHILEEGRNKGKVQVRILDKDGAFIKNAEITPKTIVIFDTFYSPRGVTHGEMMETFVKRFNPFANVERLEHKKGLYELIKYRGELPMELETKRFKELADKMDKGKQVDYISVSESNLLNCLQLVGKTGEQQRAILSTSPALKDIRPIFERIMSKGTRIFEAAGNDARFSKVKTSDRLAIEGVEGVGSLVNGKIAKESCSRNSVFTQHYERHSYRPHLVKDENDKIIGVNVTGLSGTDLPLTRKTRKIAPQVNGTSYAVPVRTAKIALNDMLKDVI